MIYLRARYYDPATGQFISRDPAVASTRSPYGYVGDNPLNATDPSGMCEQGSPFAFIDPSCWFANPADPSGPVQNPQVTISPLADANCGSGLPTSDICRQIYGFGGQHPGAVVSGGQGVMGLTPAGAGINFVALIADTCKDLLNKGDDRAKDLASLAEKAAASAFKLFRGLR